MGRPQGNVDGKLSLGQQAWFGLDSASFSRRTLFQRKWMLRKLMSKYRKLRNTIRVWKTPKKKNLWNFQNSPNALAKFKEWNSSAYLIQGSRPPSVSQLLGRASREGLSTEENLSLGLRPWEKWWDKGKEEAASSSHWWIRSPQNYLLKGNHSGRWKQPEGTRHNSTRHGHYCEVTPL